MIKNKTASLFGSLTLAFGLVACSDAPAPSGVEHLLENGTIDNATHTQLQEGCTYYTNVLELADEAHFKGAVTISQNEIAKSAYLAMLNTIHKKLSSNSEDREKEELLENYAGKEKSQPLTSLEIGGKTLSATEPSHDLTSYDDHCAYFNEGILTLAKETDTSILRLYEYAIAGALKTSRDPHTRYFTPEKAKEFQIAGKGQYGGLGILIAPNDDMIKVQKDPWEGTPADNAGLKAGDVILAMDGEPTKGITIKKALETMRGEPGSNIKLSVRRDDETFEKVLTREIINIPATTGKLVGSASNYALITINAFSRATPQSFKETFKALQSEAQKTETRLKGLFLDIRNNPGGLVEGANVINDALLEADPDGNQYPILTFKSADMNDAIPVDTFVPGKITDLPVMVLQNWRSASASEILAGTQQDSGNKIVGTRSVGKGSIQTFIPLKSNGEAKGSIFDRNPDFQPGDPGLKVTIGAFYPGKSVRSNQHSGIIPDIEVHYNDQRDTTKEKAHREQDYENTLLPPEHTRAGMSSEATCALKEEFAGVLSPEQLSTLPEYLVEEVDLLEENDGSMSQAKMFDADLDCALNYLNGGSDYTIITPNRKASLSPGN